MKSSSAEKTAQLGESLITRKFVELGFAVRRQSERDYGVDFHVELIDDEQATGRLLALQVKSGDSFLRRTEGDSFVFPYDSRHHRYWMDHSLPVAVCLCDLDKDHVYWQVVNCETTVSTGKGYKLKVPKDQKADLRSLRALKDILTPVVPTSRYDILKDSDTSVGKTKRCSLDVLVYDSVTKSEIAAIVRKITSEYAKSRIWNHETSGPRHGDEDHQVVWTFVYRSLSDHANTNPVCLSQWVDDELPCSFRPLPLTGENIGHGIIIDWKTSYLELGQLTLTRPSKRVYISRITPIIGTIDPITKCLASSLNDLADGTSSETAFRTLTAEARGQISQIEQFVRQMPWPPVECRDVDRALQSVTASLSNIALIFSAVGMTKWDARARRYLALDDIKAAEGYLAALRYESEKVQ